MKKILAVLMAVLMVASLAACGGNTSAPATEPAPAPAAANTTAPAAETTAPEQSLIDAAKAEGYECDISAHSVSEAKNYQSADMILLGPQVRYRLKEVQGELPNNKVEVIDMKDYGMMNGKAVLDHVRKVLEG